MFCSSTSPAKKRYERAVLRWIALYAVVLLSSTWLARHNEGSPQWILYFWSVVPAVPILGVIFRMAQYLREERDEFMRWQTMQSLLVGTGAMLALIVVSDFLRTMARTRPLPPFVLFMVFCSAMGATQLVQRMRNRGDGDEEPAA